MTEQSQQSSSQSPKAGRESTKLAQVQANLTKPGKRLGPQRAGTLLASALKPESMPGWPSELSISSVNRPDRLYLPGVHRDRNKIDPVLRQKINELVTGRIGWPLLILGPVGTGKTLAALCVLDAIGGGCKYSSIAELIEAVIAARNSFLFDDQTGERMTLRKFWYEWTEAKLTVVDEIGAREKVSDHDYECLKRAIDVRQGKPCIFVTNLGLERIAELYDDRIASRLAQGTVVELAGEDRRISR